MLIGSTNVYLANSLLLFICFEIFMTINNTMRNILVYINIFAHMIIFLTKFLEVELLGQRVWGVLDFKAHI